jgi:octopine/nopaline transport system substrate-binding protein
MKRLTILLLTAMMSAVLSGQVVAGEWEKIKIATEGAYPPWNYIDDSGNLVGFELDLAEEFCSRMKLECEIVAQKWRSIIKGLNTGKYDAIMAAMSITEDRKKFVKFSRNYANTPNVFVVRKDHHLAKYRSNLKYLTLNDISPAERGVLDTILKEFKGKIIGVQIGTTHAKFADLYMGDHVEIRIYDFQHTIDLELYQGRLDAVIGDYAYWQPLINSEQGKHYRIVGPEMTGGPFGGGVGVAVRKQDEDLAAMFSKAINDTIKDGTIRKLAVSWFDYDASAQP